MRNFESENTAGTYSSDDTAEHYEPILTTTQRMVLSRVCDILEDRELPFLIEHVDIVAKSNENRFENAAGYRVLVPSHFLQTAASVLQTAASAMSVLTETDSNILEH